MGKGDREPYWVAQILRREAESIIRPPVREGASAPPAGTAPAAGE